jgi:hypothetical protein
LPIRPPTDPYVRNARIRFLKQSCCCPFAVPWCPVARVGELYVSPLWPTSGCSARRRLSSRGSLGPHFSIFIGTMRRYDCPPARLGLLHLSLVPRYLACFRRAWCPFRARGQEEAPGHARAFGRPVPLSGSVVKETGGSPTFPSSPSGPMPRSQTPVVSCALAIARPGLLPSGACKPSAFPLKPEGYPAVHDYTHFGAHSRGLRPRYTRLRTAPYGEARGFATDRLARR